MKRRFIIALIILLTGAGALFAFLYYSNVYLPEKELDEAEEEMDKIIEEIRPEWDPEQDGEASGDGTGKPGNNDPDSDDKANDPDGQNGSGDKQGSDDGSNPRKGSSRTGKDPLAKARNMNAGVVGWIRVPGTNIDYPIAQAQDNEYYLDHNVKGGYSKIGCPFLDYRCEGDFSGFNSIVYGHHINRRRMFTDISRFKNASFFDEHPSAWLTLEDGAHRVDFLAYLNVERDSFVYEVVLITPNDRQEYIDKVWESAVNVTKTESLQPSKLKEDRELRLLVLSTCTYEFNNARGVLIGVIR